MRALLRRNAGANAATQYGWTPLMLAAFYGHIPIVGLLVQGGANPNAVRRRAAPVCHCHTRQSSAMHGSALMCAIRNGHSWIVHSLLSEGCAADGDRAGLVTPLMVAAQLGADAAMPPPLTGTGNETIVRHLLDKGAAVNLQAKDTGWSALMLAALNGHISIVQACIRTGKASTCADTAAQLLVANKADPNLTNVHNATALEIAAAQGQSAVEAYLDRRTDLAAKNKAAKSIFQDIFEASKKGVPRSTRATSGSSAHRRSEAHQVPRRAGARRREQAGC